MLTTVQYSTSDHSAYYSTVQYIRNSTRPVPLFPVLTTAVHYARGIGGRRSTAATGVELAFEIFSSHVALHAIQGCSMQCRNIQGRSGTVPRLSARGRIVKQYIARCALHSALETLTLNTCNKCTFCHTPMYKFLLYVYSPTRTCR